MAFDRIFCYQNPNEKYLNNTCFSFLNNTLFLFFLSLQIIQHFLKTISMGFYEEFILWATTSRGGGCLGIPGGRGKGRVRVEGLATIPIPAWCVPANMGAVVAIVLGRPAGWSRTPKGFLQLRCYQMAIRSQNNWTTTHGFHF